MGANSGQPYYNQTKRAQFQKEWAEQTSTNSYVDLDSIWDKTGFKTATIQIWNTGDTNDIDYKVLGSLNGTDYDIEIISEMILGEDDFDLIDISSFSEGAYIPYVKIQIKSNVSDSHSNVKAFGVCI